MPDGLRLVKVVLIGALVLVVLLGLYAWHGLRHLLTSLLTVRAERPLERASRAVAVRTRVHLPSPQPTSEKAAA